MQSEPINFDDTATAFAYRTTGELKNSHFVFASMSKPWMVKVGTMLTTWALKVKLPVKGVIKKTLFNQFCGGESVKDCAKTINRLGDKNVQTILDYSVEGLNNEDSYNDTKEEALRVIDFASTNDHIPFCVLKLSGLGSTDLMTKAQNRESLTEIEKTKLYYAEQRVDEIVKKISSKGLMVMIDAEESWFQSFIDGVVYRMMAKYNKERPVVYNTYQMYRHDMLDRLKRAQIQAEVDGYYLGAKLVRGAYMEKERERAEEMGYESPIHENKTSVDRDYDDALRFCMEHIDRMGLCAGTHNEESSRLLTQLMEEQKISHKDNRVFFGQLLGMSDNISFKLADLGYNVAKYVPYGPVEKVLPYLFRRAEENTSIAGQSGREFTLVKKRTTPKKVGLKKHFEKEEYEQEMQLSEQEIQRRKSREELMAMGVDPYPAESFDVNVTTRQIKENFESSPEDYTNVSIAGRLMSRRIMGSASFAEIQDSSGRIQIYIRRDDICKGEDKTLYNEIFKKKMDIGDIIGIKGYVFKTEVGETSIHVTDLKMLTKSLRPLPIVKETTDEEGNKKTYDAFTDPEQRYRQRYLDLIVNPEIRETFVQRTKLVNSIREFLAGKGYLEVETPILQPLYGGAAARPFKTHHNTLDMTLYLRIANELYLKRLIVGGYDGVFEFAKDFRNEGMSRFHNPEFTQVELYVAYKDYNWMMDTMEEMIEKVAMDIHGSTKVQVGENVIDFQRPWKRYTMFEAIEHFTNIDISNMNEEELRATAKQLGVPLDDTMAKGKIIDEIFGEKCEPFLIQPTFITDYPVEMSPLTKKHRSKEGLVERFEAICNGKEIMNSYSELNDPVDQRERFEEQLELGKRGDDEAMTLDEDFLRALEFGMPPTAGVGLGIDRLSMIMTNSNSIQDVLFFPQMRPEVKSKAAELSGDEKSVFEILEKTGKMDLNGLKEQSELSNKKWDKAIKKLTQGGFAKVEKTDEGLFVEVV